jgi:hypothetical protein
MTIKCPKSLFNLDQEGRALGEVTKYLVYNARKFFRSDVIHLLIGNIGKRGTDRRLHISLIEYH